MIVVYGGDGQYLGTKAAYCIIFILLANLQPEDGFLLIQFLFLPASRQQQTLHVAMSDLSQKEHLYKIAQISIELTHYVLLIANYAAFRHKILSVI